MRKCVRCSRKLENGSCPVCDRGAHRTSDAFDPFKSIFPGGGSSSDDSVLGSLAPEPSSSNGDFSWLTGGLELHSDDKYADPEEVSEVLSSGRQLLESAASSLDAAKSLPDSLLPGTAATEFSPSSGSSDFGLSLNCDRDTRDSGHSTDSFSEMLSKGSIASSTTSPFNSQEMPSSTILDSALTSECISESILDSSGDRLSDGLEGAWSSASGTSLKVAAEGERDSLSSKIGQSAASGRSAEPSLTGLKTGNQEQVTTPWSQFGQASRDTEYPQDRQKSESESGNSSRDRETSRPGWEAQPTTLADSRSWNSELSQVGRTSQTPAQVAGDLSSGQTQWAAQPSQTQADSHTDQVRRSSRSGQDASSAGVVRQPLAQQHQDQSAGAGRDNHEFQALVRRVTKDCRTEVNRKFYVGNISLRKRLFALARSCDYLGTTTEAQRDRILREFETWFDNAVNGKGVAPCPIPVPGALVSGASMTAPVAASFMGRSAISSRNLGTTTLDPEEWAQLLKQFVDIVETLRRIGFTHEGRDSLATNPALKERMFGLFEEISRATGQTGDTILLKRQKLLKWYNQIAITGVDAALPDGIIPEIRNAENRQIVSDYIGMSIMTLILCLNMGAPIAIYYGMVTRNSLERGDIDDAIKNSAAAQNWCIGGLLFSVLGIATMFIRIVVGVPGN